MDCAHLEWGVTPTNSLIAYKSERSIKSSEISVWLGADIVYWQTSIPPLILTLNSLYANNKGLIGYLAIKNRANNIYNELINALKKEQFTVNYIDTSGITDEKDMFLMRIDKS